jgi:formylglycine-generating enzyme required for sulfatase activity
LIVKIRKDNLWAGFIVRRLLIVKKLIGLMAVLFALFLSGNAFAQKTVDSFVEALDKTNLISMPGDLEKKAFEFVPIVAKGQSVTFKMGSTKCNQDAQPVHEVTLIAPFEMQKTEVTQLQWVLVMGNNPSTFKEAGVKHNIYGRSIYILHNRPVENMSYEDIGKFITRLNSLDAKYKYNLPTEAQWEYAARGGSTTEYYFGYDVSKLKDHAWYYDNSGDRTHDVALKLPNKFGLYDMAGNVWEWVNDYYDENYYSSLVKNLDKITDPKGPNEFTGSWVMRGGSFYSGATKKDCDYSSAHRTSGDIGGNNMGFRLVRVAK